MITALAIGARALPQVRTLPPGVQVGTEPFAATATLGRMRLPGDPVGVFTLTLTHLVVGSRILLRNAAGAIEIRSAVATSEVFTLPAYVAGDALNTITVVVRKASGSPNYQSFDTQATAFPGATTIYVNQQLDE